MPFRSILFGQSDPGAPTRGGEEPPFFRDLNLDQVVAAVTEGYEEYDLPPFFHAQLADVSLVRFRHDVFRDLRRPEVLDCVRTFAGRMRAMRGQLKRRDSLHYLRQRQRWFVRALETYRDAVAGLAEDLARLDLRSAGLSSLRDYLADYVGGAAFTQLSADVTRVVADLSSVAYCLHIKGSSIRVRRYGGEPDYSAEVEETFAKFRLGEPTAYRFDFFSGYDMNHVEAAILDRVALLYPAVFASLESVCAEHGEYLDPAIGRFDREVQFYVAWIEHMGRLEAAGLPFCYPELIEQTKDVVGSSVFDIALATKLVRDHTPVVCNDFGLNEPERIIVVSGPNQGGKTTFARMFGQLHYLAELGCPVPGSAARLFLFDRLYTHFDREEDLGDLRGKLEDDLVRIRAILEHATSRSILIMNESFGSTTLKDALFLSREVMRRVIERDLLCVSVTFLEELASLSDTVVSMVSTVDPVDPARRTFRIVRRQADGLAYAIAIAEKHRLTYEDVKERLAS